MRGKVYQSLTIDEKRWLCFVAGTAKIEVDQITLAFVNEQKLLRSLSRCGAPDCACNVVARKLSVKDEET